MEGLRGGLQHGSAEGMMMHAGFLGPWLMRREKDGMTLMDVS